MALVLAPGTQFYYMHLKLRVLQFGLAQVCLGPVPTSGKLVLCRRFEISTARLMSLIHNLTARDPVSGVGLNGAETIKLLAEDQEMNSPRLASRPTLEMIHTFYRNV